MRLVAAPLDIITSVSAIEISSRLINSEYRSR